MKTIFAEIIIGFFKLVANEVKDRRRRRRRKAEKKAKEKRKRRAEDKLETMLDELKENAKPDVGDPKPIPPNPYERQNPYK